MRVRGSWRRWGAGALLLAAAVALLPRVSQHWRNSADFPLVSSHDLAHYLADFTNHPKLDPEIEAWSVEEEEGNYTWWRYTVRYECGARCLGRVRVMHAAGATSAAGARHGAAADHHLRVMDSRCTRVPLLPWPWFCEEIEVEMSIEQEGSGARLRESARSACSLPLALVGRCRMRERRAAALAALRRAL
ncbi:PREDICTED: uncharacterized protein LOC106119145 [Papilio xuthus]|uniref:Uncharacterized protein LOC106119145 n=1 Tax=Papilio xuthus TaxID=66420 RepID=A0AAJ6ZC71_PAPXU|nr:PREDICTED: uncharacterized protein LOC106119145 [Papilio xuthus]XP_013169487.1 PREDICTED: uncharacterized protein LOC106119145 [Papilio xuthus]XP_013169488.1 PREDICTED: uncharacterized protein LOC106119145 [Papilio xuthus]